MSCGRVLPASEVFFNIANECLWEHNTNQEQEFLYIFSHLFHQTSNAVSGNPCECGVEKRETYKYLQWTNKKILWICRFSTKCTSLLKRFNWIFSFRFLRLSPDDWVQAKIWLVPSFWFPLQLIFWIILSSESVYKPNLVSTASLKCPHYHVSNKGELF